MTDCWDEKSLHLIPVGTFGFHCTRDVSVISSSVYIPSLHRELHLSFYLWPLYITLPFNQFSIKLPDQKSTSKKWVDTEESKDTIEYKEDGDDLEFTRHKKSKGREDDDSRGGYSLVSFLAERKRIEEGKGIEERMDLGKERRMFLWPHNEHVFDLSLETIEILARRHCITPIHIDSVFPVFLCDSWRSRTLKHEARCCHTFDERDMRDLMEDDSCSHSHGSLVPLLMIMTHDDKRVKKDVHVWIEKEWYSSSYHLESSFHQHHDVLLIISYYSVSDADRPTDVVCGLC